MYYADMTNSDNRKMLVQKIEGIGAILRAGRTLFMEMPYDEISDELASQLMAHLDQINVSITDISKIIFLKSYFRRF